MQNMDSKRKKKEKDNTIEETLTRRNVKKKIQTQEDQYAVWVFVPLYEMKHHSS
jgi:hypothetical protein